jgi:hypothetical protein
MRQAVRAGASKKLAKGPSHRLRWQLCKIYQKRVDDPMFETTNDAQLMWYQTQIHLDTKDQFELLRDVAEHNAMFMNPEGVQQVRNTRDNTFEMSDNEFNEMLENTFGRAISEVPSDELDVTEMLNNDRLRSKYSQIVDMDLDDVVFTPFK